MVCRGSAQAGTARNAHGGAVTGIAIDSLNKVMGTAGADGWLRVWDFRKRTLLREVRVGAAITHAAFHAVSGLISLACADLVIRMCNPSFALFPPYTLYSPSFRVQALVDTCSKGFTLVREYDVVD